MTERSPYPDVLIDLTGALDNRRHHQPNLQRIWATPNQYLAVLYPVKAQFVGEQVNETGKLTEIGQWERKEKRSTPALVKNNTLLNGQQPRITPHSKLIAPIVWSAALIRECY